MPLVCFLVLVILFWILQPTVVSDHLSPLSVPLMFAEKTFLCKLEHIQPI